MLERIKSILGISLSRSFDDIDLFSQESMRQFKKEQHQTKRPFEKKPSLDMKQLSLNLENTLKENKLAVSEKNNEIMRIDEKIALINQQLTVLIKSSPQITKVNSNPLPLIIWLLKTEKAIQQCETVLNPNTGKKHTHIKLVQQVLATLCHQANEHTKILWDTYNHNITNNLQYSSNRPGPSETQLKKQLKETSTIVAAIKKIHFMATFAVTNIKKHYHCNKRVNLVFFPNAEKTSLTYTTTPHR